MDFLKQVKTPSTKNHDLLNITTSKEINFTEDNNEKLLQFLKILGKNINLRNFRYLGYAKKTGKTLTLAQMDEKMLRIIKQKQKMTLINRTQKKDEEAKHRITSPARTKESEIKAKINQQNEDDLANNNHESMFEFATKYKKYSEDNTIFSIPMSDSYVLNNKLSFIGEIRDKLTKYLNISNKDIEKEISCEESSENTGFDPLIHQELVKQYLNSYSPYRGLVLYHGLGSGKTCTSVGISEAMKSSKKKNLY